MMSMLQIIRLCHKLYISLNTYIHMNSFFCNPVSCLILPHIIQTTLVHCSFQWPLSTAVPYLPYIPYTSLLGEVLVDMMATCHFKVCSHCGHRLWLTLFHSIVCPRPNNQYYWQSASSLLSFYSLWIKWKVFESPIMNLP